MRKGKAVRYNPKKDLQTLTPSLLRKVKVASLSLTARILETKDAPSASTLRYKERQEWENVLTQAQGKAPSLLQLPSDLEMSAIDVAESIVLR